MSEPVNHSTITHQIHLAGCILSERVDPDRRFEELLFLPAVIGADQSPDKARAVIPVKVNAIPLRHGTAIDVPACDRATAFLMAIFGNRINQIRGGAAFVVMGAFAQVPAEVGATWGTTGQIIDLLPVALPHVTDIQITSQFIKRKPPGIAQAICPDLIPKWIIRWHCIRIGRINIQAQDFPQQNICPLTISGWITCRATVAESRVEITIWAKGEHTAVVIRERLIYTQ